MPSTKYTRSISSVLPGGLTEDILMIEINQNPNIAKACLDVGRSGDDLSITMDDTLDGAEETELDNVVVASHSPLDFFAKHSEEEYNNRGFKVR